MSDYAILRAAAMRNNYFSPHPSTVARYIIPPAAISPPAQRLSGDWTLHSVANFSVSRMPATRCLRNHRFGAFLVAGEGGAGLTLSCFTGEGHKRAPVMQCSQEMAAFCMYCSASMFPASHPIGLKARGCWKRRPEHALDGPSVGLFTCASIIDAKPALATPDRHQSPSPVHGRSRYQLSAHAIHPKTSPPATRKVFSPIYSSL